MNNADRPIGLFDSGVGGLTLLRELENLLPYEDFIYYGDTARLPYGTKTEEDLIKISSEIIETLIKKHCKLIVIACNTVSGLLPEIHYSQEKEIPIIGMINYGCVSAALYVTYNFRIGVLATERTINSGVYRKSIDIFDPTIKLFPQICTDLIPLIETGMIGSPITRKTAEKYLTHFIAESIDTLILGCTHLPFIRNIIQDILGPAITLIDPARRTAVLCLKTLQDKGIFKSDKSKTGTRKFFISGDPVKFQKTVNILTGKKINAKGITAVQ